MKTRKEKRQELGRIFRDVLGTPYVYFRKPSEKLHYPCILYDRSGDTRQNADNLTYLKREYYTGQVIDANPDSEIPDKLDEALAYYSPGRVYKADGLNHYPFTVYY